MYADSYEEFKVGDLITAYHKGFWRLTKIKRRFYTHRDVTSYSSCKDFKEGDEYNPLFYYELVRNSKYNKPSYPKEEYCDSSFCRKVDDAYIAGQLKELVREMTALQEIYQEVTGKASAVDLSKIEFPI